MKPPPPELYATTGEPVTDDKWNGLIDWARQYQLVVPPNLGVRSGPDGTILSYTGDVEIHTPYEVTIRGAESASIRPGYLADDMARVETEDGDLVRLDGSDMDWLPHDATDGSRPVLPIEPPDSSAPRSFLALRLLTDDSGEWDREDPYALTVVHVTPEAMAAARIENERLGFQPVAVLYWDEDRKISQTIQVVHHHLNHAFRPNQGADRRAEHFFFAV